jgi:hypothetical protein
MRRMIHPLVLVLGCAAAAAAFAQPAAAPTSLPTEKVIVTAPKAVPEEVIKGFVKSYAAPAPALGRMAKWVRGICPVTIGLPPSFNALVTGRVKEIAALVGAPVEAKAPCQTNIDIVFTRQPQVLLDGIREKHPVYLGYYNRSQLAGVATVRYPVQAWYTTETEDLHGLRQVDNAQDANHGADIVIPPNTNPACPSGCTWHLPYARQFNVDSGHLSDGLRSEFFHIVIVADLARVNGQEIGAVADYIATLALSQTGSFDACLTPPSITNLMSPGCDTSLKTTTITQMDTAYLRGLYKANFGSINFSQQRGDVVFQMKKELAGR